MTQDNGIDREGYIDPQSAGALARIFAGIASHIADKNTDAASEMAKLCMRQMADIAIKEGGEWKPLSDEQYLAGLEESRRRQQEMQARWAARQGITAGGAPCSR